MIIRGLFKAGQVHDKQKDSMILSFEFDYASMSIIFVFCSMWQYFCMSNPNLINGCL